MAVQFAQRFAKSGTNPAHYNLHPTGCTSSAGRLYAEDAPEMKKKWEAWTSSEPGAAFHHNLHPPGCSHCHLSDGTEEGAGE